MSTFLDNHLLILAMTGILYAKPDTLLSTRDLAQCMYEIAIVLRRY